MSYLYEKAERPNLYRIESGNAPFFSDGSPGEGAQLGVEVQNILVFYVVFFVLLAAGVDVGVDEDGDHCEPSHHRLDPRKS